MYEHVVEHLPQTRHSKAQSTLHKATNKYVPTVARQRKQAKLARASMSSSTYAARGVLKTDKEIEICPAKYPTTRHKAAEAGVMREGLAFIFNLNKIEHCSFSPSFLFFRTCMRRPGCFPGAWSSWIFASRQFAQKIMDLSVHFIGIMFY